MELGRCVEHEVGELVDLTCRLFLFSQKPELKQLAQGFTSSAWRWELSYSTRAAACYKVCSQELDEVEKRNADAWLPPTSMPQTWSGLANMLGGRQFLSLSLSPAPHYFFLYSFSFHIQNNLPFPHFTNEQWKLFHSR